MSLFVFLINLIHPFSLTKQDLEITLYKLCLKQIFKNILVLTFQLRLRLCQIPVSVLLFYISRLFIIQKVKATNDILLFKSPVINKHIKYYNKPAIKFSN